MEKRIVVSGLLQGGKVRRLEIEDDYLKAFQNEMKMIAEGIKKAPVALTTEACPRMYRGRSNLENQNLN